MEVQDFSKDEQKELLARYAQMSFANLKKNIAQDLINNRNESIIYKKFTKEEIVRMLENPQKNEHQIRELSRFIYIVSSHYRRLIDYYSTILLYHYSIIPIKMQTKKPNEKKFKNAYYYVANECEKYNLPHEATKAMKITIRDGVFFGLYYETSDSFYIKNVEPKYARISSIEDGAYRFSFDLSYFNGKDYLLNMYGDDFKNAYYIYKGNKEKGIKGDKTKRWYEPVNCIVLKADESDPLYSFTPLLDLIMSVLDVDDYKMLKKAKAEIDNYKVLSFLLPTDNEGLPLIDFDLAKKYFSSAIQDLPQNLAAILTPFDVKDMDFQKNNSADANNVSDAITTFYETAGVPESLFGGGNISSQGAMLLSVKPDESFVYSILQQFERFFNMKIKKMNLPYEFKIKFSRLSIFNQDEYTNRLAKAAQYSLPAKMEYASSLGMSPSDVLGMTYLEDLLGLGKTTWNTPLISSNTQSSVDSQETGRPTAEESGTVIGDAGEKSREQN